MYQVFNMGHRLEVFLPMSLLQKKMIEAAKQLHIEAQIVGRVEATTGENELLLQGSFWRSKVLTSYCKLCILFLL
jgi:phosphoribosylformylglycinamidine cyclo-ligase